MSCLATCGYSFGIDFEAKSIKSLVGCELEQKPLSTTDIDKAQNSSDNPEARVAVVKIATGLASSSISRTLAFGYPKSIGRYAPPAFRMPRIAASISGERSR